MRKDSVATQSICTQHYLQIPFSAFQCQRQACLLYVLIVFGSGYVSKHGHLNLVGASAVFQKGQQTQSWNRPAGQQELPLSFRTSIGHHPNNAPNTVFDLALSNSLVYLDACHQMLQPIML